MFSGSWLSSYGEDLEQFEVEEKQKFLSTSHGNANLNNALMTEDLSYKGESLQPGVYSLAVTSIIHDAQHLTPVRGNHMARLCSSVTLAMGVLILQGFILYCTQTIVTPSSVADARKAYGEFEAHMYTMDGVQHTYLTTYGHERGVGWQYFDPANFKSLDEAHKKLLCQMPLSSPTYSFLILLLWTLDALGHVRIIVNLSLRFIRMPTVPPTGNMIVRHASGEHQVSGLTLCIKFILVFFIQLPRLVATLCLLFLGLRWLLSTMSFAGIVFAAAGLHFILETPVLVFKAIVPYHSAYIVDMTTIPPISTSEKAGWCSSLGMYFLGIFAVVLAYLYMFHFQTVLPDYKWDTSTVCSSFLAAKVAE